MENIRVRNSMMSNYLMRLGIPFFRYLLLVIYVSIPVYGATYYVDASNGNDFNNGTSQDTAWKTISKVNSSSFNPGDNILFKREEIWREALVVPASGSYGNPITFGTYGSGDKPIISCRDSIPGWSVADNWIQDGNVWSINLSIDPYRMFLSGTEYIEAETEGSVNSSERWWYDRDNNNLKIYATMNPSTAYLNVEGARVVAFSTVFITKSFIVLHDLDVRGGAAAIELEDLDHVIIDNCTVGLYSGYQGVRLVGCSGTVDYCEIKNCMIESGYNNWDYSYLRPDGYHLQDGIYIGHGANYNKVYGNTISNWGHACVGVENLDHPAETSNYNEIFENILTSPNTNYNRGFFTDAGSTTGMCAYNKIYRNLIQNTTVKNQIHGNNNEVYYNIIINVIDNPNYGESWFAQGISMFSAEGQVCHDNKIYNNVICNTDDIGLTIIDDKGWGVKENNLIKNNIIFNFGGDYGISITDWDYGTVKGNTYQNNLIYKFGESNVIYYRGSAESVSTFNGENGNNNDVIGNNIQLDPLFADPFNNNFNLQSTSPAIDAGFDVDLTEDFDGNSVPHGLAPDIGAFEYQGNDTHNLDCNGILSWTNVKPGSVVNGSFTVENVGDPGSEIDWCITEWPSWGTWTFTPISGDDLSPEDGPVTVNVSVVAPDEQNKGFTGGIEIVNKANINDFCMVPVSLATPKNKQMNSTLFIQFLEIIIEHFPMLEWLLKLPGL